MGVIQDDTYKHEYSRLVLLLPIRAGRSALLTLVLPPLHLLLHLLHQLLPLLSLLPLRDDLFLEGTFDVEVLLCVGGEAAGAAAGDEIRDEDVQQQPPGRCDGGEVVARPHCPLSNRLPLHLYNSCQQYTGQSYFGRNMHGG
jgi:hypothetical protein